MIRGVIVVTGRIRRSFLSIVGAGPLNSVFVRLVSERIVLVFKEWIRKMIPGPRLA